LKIRFKKNKKNNKKQKNKNMPNFEKTVIYKISCAGQDYVGHSTDYRRRCIAHKYDCTNEKSRAHNLLLYRHIRASGGFESCVFSILEEYPCDTAQEARLREQHWLKEVNASLNTNTPGLTRAQSDAIYNANHRDEIKEKNHEYRETHRDEINKKQNEYRLKHRDEINERRREYRANNKKLKAACLHPQKDPTIEKMGCNSSEIV
jgi:hypothetical protein